MRDQTAFMYRELHRPQFHFTPVRDWMNDPNGLVCYKGEFHLYLQYSPGFMNHAPNSWGHAISTDLVHWQQIANGLEPDDYGWVWSGSAVVDRTSLELFAGHGRTSASFCFLPGPCDYPLEFYSKAGSARIASLTIHELASAWE